MKTLSDQQKGSLLAFVAVMFITPDSLFIRLSNIDTWGLVFYRGAIPFFTVLIGMLLIYKLNFFKILFSSGHHGLIYIATDGSGLTIFDRNAVEVDSEELLQINIYPNPASDVLLLTNIEGTGTCRIINTQGKVLLEQSIEMYSSLIDVRHLSKGIYLVELILQNSRQQSQLIIQ